MGGSRRDRIAREARRRAMPLGTLVREGVGVFCWCNRCGHNATLASEPLAAELGHDFPVSGIGARLRCSGCGAKDAAARPDWPSLGQVARH